MVLTVMSSLIKNILFSQVSAVIQNRKGGDVNIEKRDIVCYLYLGETYLLPDFNCLKYKYGPR